MNWAGVRRRQALPGARSDLSGLGEDPAAPGLDELVTTTTVLALDRLLSEDSTFYGDLFPHAVKWHGVVYLEDGLHRAVRAMLRGRTVLHARVFDMDAGAL